MKIMSEGLQRIAGDKLRGILSTMTVNRVAGVLTGTLITALVQSSSATTVMVVSFVNAGILTLAQSISVIMGANIGTTVTAWIISLFGFKVNIGLIALPLIGIAIPLMFSKRNKRKYLGEFVIGFALLFMGLDFLKTNMPNLQNNPSILEFLQGYTNMGFASVLLFMLVGTILTIIVQSSSATVAITLIMCSKGWISFEIAAAMVLGENIGTTITANLAAIPANISARRAAFAHFMFNVFGVIWMLVVFYPFTSMISYLITKTGAGNPHDITEFLGKLDSNTIAQITGGQALDDPHLAELRKQLLSTQTSVSYSLSLFHTMFNIINVCMMIWFVNIYVKICMKIIKSKKNDEEFQLKYISSGLLSTSELSILEVKREVVLYAGRTLRMLEMNRELYYVTNENDFVRIFGRIEKYENIIDRMEVEIGNYLTKVSEGRLSAESKEVVLDILRAVSEIESIGDAMFNMARTIKRRYEDKCTFGEELNKHVEDMYNLAGKALERMIAVLKIQEPTEIDGKESLNIEHEINHFRNVLKTHNLEDINAQKYDYKTGVLYMDYIAECEKLGDYVINVVEAWCRKGFKIRE
jgi:phosphate:Na+ symporter